MLGLSKASKAKKVYDSIESQLNTIKEWTHNNKLPEKMWADPYMIGYFFKTVALADLITNKKPYSATPDQMVIKLCFEDYICPENFKVFENNLFNLMDKELKAKKIGALKFDDLGNHISKDVDKDIDEFLLGNRHASRVIFLLGGVLKEEIIQKDTQILEAKKITHQNKPKDEAAAEKLGFKYRDMLPFYLSKIYLKSRIEDLCSNEL
tara:strand:- start:745 stop:1368 length:624 start_codon:yes stop_codon:yes gene_type:complete